MVKEFGYDTTGGRVGEFLLDRMNSLKYGREIQKARKLSDEAMQFAGQHLGFNPKPISIKPYMWQWPWDRRDSLSVGEWDEDANTAYINFRSDNERSRTVVHETGHVVAHELWIAAGEYKSLLRDKYSLHDKAREAFFDLDFKKLSPETFKTIAEEENWIDEEVRFGELRIKMTKRPGLPLVEYQYHIYHGMESLTDALRGIPANSEEFAIVLAEKLDGAPLPVRTAVSDLFTSLFGLDLTDARISDLKVLSEGFAEFFAYAFLKSRGTQTTKLSKSPDFEVKKPMRVRGEEDPYQLGFNLMMALAEKVGDLNALRIALGVSSTQELVDIIRGKK
ncbi:MAG: hypothetical protein Q7R51_02645 [bacterium]|nr:hypothetical protein [bacterium]